MSNRSVLEFDHDYCPSNDTGYLALGRALAAHMRGADPRGLPRGVVSRTKLPGAKKKGKTKRAAIRFAEGNFTRPSPAEILKAYETTGFTAIVLAGWGVPWPPQEGWRRRLEQRWREENPVAVEPYRPSPMTGEAKVIEPYDGLPWE